jgi:rubrerythrin
MPESTPLLSACKEMIDIYHRFEKADLEDEIELNILFNAAVKKVEEEVKKVDKYLCYFCDGKRFISHSGGGQSPCPVCNKMKGGE